LRFAVVGPLLAAPPARGELHAELEKLSARAWTHPVTGEPTRFGLSTIERWYYQAKNAGPDPVGRLRRKGRKDRGQRRSMAEPLVTALLSQFAAHRSWSYKLHFDNLVVVVGDEPELGPLPSYSTVVRFMKRNGLIKRRRRSSAETAAARQAEARLDEREVRGYEASHVDALWHLDFHHGSLRVLTPAGEWVTPNCMAVLDDRSRLCCHLQWYLGETAEDLVHALCQAVQKRRLPRALMTDNGAAMTAAETTQGLARLGIVHETTLPYSPYQNGKQEVFWSQVEGRLMSMLEGCDELTLPLLNDASQAWVELEYNRKVHRETGEAPLRRWLDEPHVGRPSPGSEALRMAFCMDEQRTQRRSDGTVSVGGRRFELPGRFRHLERVTVRYPRWDLGLMHLICEQTGTVLCRLSPQDKQANADGRRRKQLPLPIGELPAAPPKPGMAPLLQRLMAEYTATGLPPAWLPQLPAEEAP